MSHEADVDEAVRNHALELGRRYVETYEKLDAPGKAEMRSKLIEGQNDTFASVMDGAFLQVLERLDAHPAERAALDQAIHSEDRMSNSDIPTMGVDRGAEGRQSADAFRKDLENLTGNSLGAAAQGISNLRNDDPVQSIRNAAPIITATEMLMANGEANELAEQNERWSEGDPGNPSPWEERPAVPGMSTHRPEPDKEEGGKENESGKGGEQTESSVDDTIGADDENAGDAIRGLTPGDNTLDVLSEPLSSDVPAEKGASRSPRLLVGSASVSRATILKKQPKNGNTRWIHISKQISVVWTKLMTVWKGRVTLS